MTKYEQLIEYIINEDEEKARELFHQIVVEKSREIYESIMEEEEEEDLDEVVGGDQVESMIDEITADEEGMQEAEEDSEEDEEDSEEDSEEEEDGEEEMDLDAEGDMEMDMDMDVESDDDAPVTKKDLADFQDDIEATFRQIMAQEMGDDGMDDEVDAEMTDMDAELGMDMKAEGDEEEMEGMYMEAKAAKKEEMLAKKAKRKMTEAEWLREYVDKIGDVYGQQPAQGEGNEVGNGKKAKVSAQSIVAGKNDMGGTAKNLNQADKGEDPDGKQTPQPNNEFTKGRGNLPHAGKFQNVPGAKTKPSDSGKPEYSKAHGAEGQTTGGKMPVSTKSPLAS